VDSVTANWTNCLQKCTIYSVASIKQQTNIQFKSATNGSYEIAQTAN